MNRSIRAAGVVAVAAGVVVACGRAPEPGSAPPAESSVRPDGTTETPDGTTASPPEETSAAPTVTPQPTHSHPAPATTATPKAKPKPAPKPTTSVKPQPPDRWVLTSADRRRFEERTHTSFANIAADGLIRDVCPKHNACLGIAFRVDPGLGHEDEDCWIDRVVIPDPLSEGGTVTWVVNNPCDSGT